MLNLLMDYTHANGISFVIVYMHEGVDTVLHLIR